MFQVQDSNGRRFALKRLAVNNQADLKVCKQEVAVMVSVQPILISMIYKYISYYNHKCLFTI